MAVDITKQTSGTAQITWHPRNDDPRGYVAKAIETGRLEDALTVLGASTIEHLMTSPGSLKHIAQSTALIQRELERRMRSMVVELKDRQGLSWSEIAFLLYEDSEKRSSARAVYNAGVRQLGLDDAQVHEDQDDDPSSD